MVNNLRLSGKSSQTKNSWFYKSCLYWFPEVPGVLEHVFEKLEKAEMSQNTFLLYYSILYYIYRCGIAAFAAICLSIYVSPYRQRANCWCTGRPSEGHYRGLIQVSKTVSKSGKHCYLQLVRKKLPSRNSNSKSDKHHYTQQVRMFSYTVLKETLVARMQKH